jgi:hypothetical protein
MRVYVCAYMFVLPITRHNSIVTVPLSVQYTHASAARRQHIAGIIKGRIVCKLFACMYMCVCMCVCDV